MNAHKKKNKIFLIQVHKGWWFNLRKW
jgi:hypothetical protein